jgi:hypothetical protein
MFPVQGTLSLLVGAYYAGLYGLTAPDLAVVSYALLGLLVLFHMRVKDVPAPLYTSGALALLWGSWALLQFGTNPQKRRLSDVLESCDSDICQQLEKLLASTGDTARWQDAPHTKARRQGLTVLAATMTLVLASYYVMPDKPAPAAPAALVEVPAVTPGNWWAVLVLAAWVGWVAWAMASLSTHMLVAQAQRDMIYPELEGGGPGLSHVTPMVTKMQLYLTVGVAVVAALALAPDHPALPLLCHLYLFMGMYFLSNLYQVNRLLTTWALLNQEARPQLPSFTAGIGVLGGGVALVLVALHGTKDWKKALTWPLLMLGAMGFAAWDTHANERVKDTLG